VNRKHILIIAATILIVLGAATWTLFRQKRRVQAIPPATATPVVDLIEETWGYTNDMHFTGDIYELRAGSMATAFPQTKFYIMEMGPPGRGASPLSKILAIREGMLYEMPKHFNLLLVDAGRSATGPEQEAVLQTLVIVALPEMASLPIRFEGYKEIHEEEGHFITYEVELISWSKGGIRMHWKFAFRQDRQQVLTAWAEVLAVGEGSFVSRSDGSRYQVGDELEFGPMSAQELEELR
jgi:hypothetical protein